MAHTSMSMNSSRPLSFVRARTRPMAVPPTSMPAAAMVAHRFAAPSVQPFSTFRNGMVKALNASVAPPTRKNMTALRRDSGAR